jgi:hypothetical protein
MDDAALVFSLGGGEGANVTSFPPKPKEAEMGRRSHLGGCLSESVVWVRWEKSGSSKISAPSGWGAACDVDVSCVDWRE